MEVNRFVPRFFTSSIGEIKKHQKWFIIQENITIFNKTRKIQFHKKPTSKFSFDSQSWIKQWALKDGKWSGRGQKFNFTRRRSKEFFPSKRIFILFALFYIKRRGKCAMILINVWRYAEWNETMHFIACSYKSAQRELIFHSRCTDIIKSA